MFDVLRGKVVVALDDFGLIRLSYYLAVPNRPDHGWFLGSRRIAMRSAGLPAMQER
jgi:hypothetical protein